VKTLSIDFETRSPVDLIATGVYPYAADPDTDIWCMAYAFGDEEPKLWLMGEDPPADVVSHVQAGGEIRAWNAQFERVIWTHILSPRYGFPLAKLEQFVCSAVEAAAMALPRALGNAAAALGAEAQKDTKGKALMLRMAKPLKRLENGTYLWRDDDESRRLLYEYCKQDVRTERAIIAKLVRLTPREREVYLLDQRMNDRGVQIDRPLVLAAQEIALEGIERANQTLLAATNYQVPKVTSNAKLLLWLRERGYDITSTDKATVAELLTRDLPADVQAALIARSEAGRSSVAKLKTMLESASRDDRVRGMLLFHGATTGRWAGRLVQPQNFPRGSVEDVERFIEPILDGDYERLDLEHPPVEIVSSLLRAMLVARPGHVFMAADYSAIEARVVNWLAGQEDVLQLFREGKDVYKYNAMRLYNIPLEEVKKFPHRQTGKFQELGCGFQMGAKRAVEAARLVYGLTLTKEQAKEIVSNYRETHPKVVNFWKETEEACKIAIRTPGTAIRFGAESRLIAAKMGGYLVIQLPSGRKLFYPAPRIVQAKAPWVLEAIEEWNERKAAAALANEPFTEEEPEMKYIDNIEFSAMLKTGWGRERTYGGKLVENITQAVARDLMAEAMLRVEHAGFTPVLTVHDEIVTEVPEDLVDLPRFEDLLTHLPAWATGCPIAAEGWTHTRYKK
jgi:DNA polymerase bacteriophage-type